jgi:hypothetical protein
MTEQQNDPEQHEGEQPSDEPTADVTPQVTESGETPRVILTGPHTDAQPGDTPTGYIVVGPDLSEEQARAEAEAQLAQQQSSDDPNPANPDEG